MRSKRPARELLRISIDMGPGDSQTIRVMEGEDPKRIAEAFAERHGLGDGAANVLEAQIRSNIEVSESFNDKNGQQPNEYGENSQHQDKAASKDNESYPRADEGAEH
jgi:hypothetical protein